MDLDQSDFRLPAHAVALRPGQYRYELVLATGVDNQHLLRLAGRVDIESLLQGQQLLEGIEKARRELLSGLPDREDD